MPRILEKFELVPGIHEILVEAPSCREGSAGAFCDVMPMSGASVSADDCPTMTLRPAR